MPQLEIHTIYDNIIIGTVTGSRPISVSDYIFLPTISGEKRFRIRDVHVNDQSVTLEFSEAIHVELDELASMNVKILTPVRGIDLHLATSYGIGGKWWMTLLMNLLLIGLMALIFYIFHLIKIS